MSRNRRGSRPAPTFAAIVDDVQRRPSSPAPDTRSRVRAPDGRVYLDTDPDTDLDPAAALALLTAGAAVAWDSCGCQGYCGIEWFDAADAARLVRDGPPEFVTPSRKVPHIAGRLHAWHTADGQVLVLASREVRWGGLMF